MRRRFARLAALLETADGQFQTISDEVTKYASSVAADLKRTSAEVAIDGTSVCQLISSDPDVRGLDEEISRESGRPLGKAEPYMCSQTAEYLLDVGLTTTTAVKRIVCENRERIVEAALIRLSRGIRTLWGRYRITLCGSFEIERRARTHPAFRIRSVSVG